MNKNKIRYRTILIDPPWPQTISGEWKKHKVAKKLPYKTMSVQKIKELPINNIAEEGAHLWLWTTNQFVKEAYEVAAAWGFKVLTVITWVKPSGCGNWFVSRTQHCLFGYKNKCQFNKSRYKPTVFYSNLPKKHSEKPEDFYELIESISDAPRLELFARKKRKGWNSWGDEIKSDVKFGGT
jgi:N6-adenosine-specific RNA methylase IME4